jgi:peptide subunit release factor 1 (eRF1)
LIIKEDWSNLKLMERKRHFLSRGEARGVNKLLSRSREVLELEDFRTNETNALALISLKIFQAAEIPPECLTYLKRYWRIKKDIFEAVTEEQMRTSDEALKNFVNKYPEDLERNVRFVAAMRLITGNFAKSPGRG